MKSLELFIIFFIAAYNLVTLPFNSFIITLVIATLAFISTKSLLFTASVFVIPQLIRLMNIILLNKNESFVPKNPEEVINTVKQFKQAKQIITVMCNTIQKKNASSTTKLLTVQLKLFTKIKYIINSSSWILAQLRELDVPNQRKLHF
jgi:hypothetical protein